MRRSPTAMAPVAVPVKDPFLLGLPIVLALAHVRRSQHLVSTEGPGSLPRGSLKRAHKSWMGSFRTPYPETGTSHNEVLDQKGRLLNGSPDTNSQSGALRLPAPKMGDNSRQLFEERCLDALCRPGSGAKLPCAVSGSWPCLLRAGPWGWGQVGWG